MQIVGRRTEAANCVELAGFAGSAIFAELAEIVVSFAELAGFAVAVAAGCVELAGFVGTGVVRFAELAEGAEMALCADLATLGIVQLVLVQRRKHCINTC